MTKRFCYSGFSNLACLRPKPILICQKNRATHRDPRHDYLLLRDATCIMGVSVKEGQGNLHRVILI